MSDTSQYRIRAKAIKDKMQGVGLTAAEVSRRLERTYTHVSLCINGHRRSDLLLDQIESIIKDMEEEEPELARAA